MPKKRKTRKQKIVNDQKRQVVSENTSSVTSAPMQITQQVKHEPAATGTFTLPTITENAAAKAHTAKQTVTVSISEYGYLPTDLLRTAVISGAIVLTELFIRFIFVH